VPIPDAVRGTVLGRLRRLGRAERTVLLRASAIGRHFPLRVAVAAAARPEPDVRLALEHARVLHVRRLRSASEIEGLLSARELEVATLGAGGRSSMEIARELSITHKTVEKHLGSAYQKLNISSRAQLEAHVTPRHN
jgi:DNA-binding CsgD family transcriptional regulator